MIALMLLAAGCGGPDASCGEDDPGERLLRRLTHSEYDRTVGDLLGVDEEPGRFFAADPVIEGFRNDAEALGVDGLLADQYRGAAEELAATVAVSTLLPCDPDASGAEDCAMDFVEHFGLRAFRRPLSDDDVVRYVDLWATVAADDGFDEGIRWVITAMLQSPHFLYRSELGAHDKGKTYALTDWEMATALSYTLWGTMPDNELFLAAAAGALATDDEIDAHVQRMLIDDRARHLAAGFVDAWLDLGQLQTVSREGLTSDLRATMRADIHTWIEGLALGGGTLADLMSEGALITQPGVLTRWARADGSSPIHRGLMVRERLLCEDLPPPPPNLDTIAPEVDPSLSTRERFAAHTSAPPCAICHDQIDPLGVGFEHFDQLGQWRTDDAGHTIDATGDLDGLPYDGAEELSELLIDDERFRTCFVWGWRRHARGTHACGEDLGPDVPLLAPVAAIPTTYGFRHRRGGRSEGDTFAVDGIAPAGAIDPEVGEGGGVETVGLQLVVTNDWGDGYCADGTAHNDSDEPVAWMGQWPSDGDITSIWNATVEQRGDDWLFRSDDPDAQLEPGGIATFGFCANRW